MICEDTEGHEPKFATDPMAAFIKHLYLCPPRLTSAQAVTALKRYFGFLLTGDSLAWQIQPSNTPGQEEQSSAIAGTSPALGPSGTQGCGARLLQVRALRVMGERETAPTPRGEEQRGPQAHRYPQACGQWHWLSPQRTRAGGDTARGAPAGTGAGPRDDAAAGDGHLR